MALFDPVTALANRMHFRNETEALLAAAPVERLDALFFIDLDNFKGVNDRSMIADITHCNESRAILQSSVTVLNSLGKETVAEGVETQDQFDMLRVMGCKAAQGYAIARPGSEAALRNFMVPAEAPPARRKA
jgi:predicted signal transduction protein with EAL and GGDEF domain